MKNNTLRAKIGSEVSTAKVLLGDDIYLLNDYSIIRLNEFSLTSQSPIARNVRKLLPGYKSENSLLLYFKLIDPILQPDVENKCRFAKCSHLCLPSDGIQVFGCFCPQNYDLKNSSICEERKSQAFDPKGVVCVVNT